MNAANDAFTSGETADRMAHGPFGILPDCQMMRISDIFSIFLSTIDRRLPRVYPSAISPWPDVQVTAASYCLFSTATTPCSCPPENPVLEK